MADSKVKKIDSKWWIVKYTAWGLEMMPNDTHSIVLYHAPKKGEEKWFVPIEITFPAKKITKKSRS